jgi:hypothetical protein
MVTATKPLVIQLNWEFASLTSCCLTAVDKPYKHGAANMGEPDNVPVWCFMFTRARVAQVCRSFSEEEGGVLPST